MGRTGWKPVREQVGEADDVDRDAVYLRRNPPRVAVRKITPGNTRQNFDPQRLDAHANDPAFFQEEMLPQFRRGEPELPDDGHHPGGVLRTDGYPEVHVPGVAVVAVVADGIAADEDVVNAVGIQQLQKVAKVRG